MVAPTSYGGSNQLWWLQPAMVAPISYAQHPDITADDASTAEELAT